ncbi:PemI [Clostridium beijerinckii]|nr:PemI [Clostridium beijerinckii]
MKRKITINKSDDRAINGRLTIPVKLLQEMGITERDRDVIINLDGNKLIIEKVEDDRRGLDRKISMDITQEEIECLLL